MQSVRSPTDDASAGGSGLRRTASVGPVAAPVLTSAGPGPEAGRAAASPSKTGGIPQGIPVTSLVSIEDFGIRGFALDVIESGCREVITTFDDNQLENARRAHQAIEDLIRRLN